MKYLVKDEGGWKSLTQRVVMYNVKALRLSIFTSLILASTQVGAAAKLPQLTVKRILISSHSVKIQYASYPGARDYECYDAADPKHVKFAGIVHHFDATGDYIGDSPNLEIEFNGLEKNTPYTLIVEAVNAIGPVPRSALYNGNNQALQQSSMPGMDGIGSNMGMVGEIEEVNGQGASQNSPVAIAEASVSAMCTGSEPIPSGIPGATDCIMAPFAGGTIGPLVVTDASLGNGTQSLTSGSSRWTLGWHQADLTASSVFNDHRHLMVTLFDAASYTSGLPMHIAHGAVSMTPVQRFADGMVHTVVAVDSHTYSRRWITPLALAPDKDPVTNFDIASGPVNTSDTALFFQVQNNNYFLDYYDGFNSDGTPRDISIVGALGQAPIVGTRANNGRGFDDRTRFDEFVTPTHFQAYEDGVLVVDCDLPDLEWIVRGSQVNVAQYNYHSSLGLSELQEYMPWESYWINDVPYSDERHWADTGVEVLPETTSWKTVQKYMATVAPGWVRP